MNRYVTGATIKDLRVRRGLKQSELADILAVSDKTVSRWETGKGYPDITLLDPLAKALGASLIELLAGNVVENANVAANMKLSKFYVCPACGNVIVTAGEASVSCHGLLLRPLEPEAQRGEHAIEASVSDGEIFVTLGHPMLKQHHISFIAAVSPDRVQLVKKYPESSAEARFKMDGVGAIYAYCSEDGLFKLRFPV